MDDTTTSIRRNSSAETLNMAALSLNHKSYRLLSCRIDVTQTPAVFEVEQVPIAPLDPRPVTEHDLYFLRWVLRGLFEQLSAEIEKKHRGYKVLRAEIEPGISWDDFRTDRRGLLVWLVKDAAVDEIAKGGEAAASQLAVIKSQLGELMRHVDELSKQLVPPVQRDQHEDHRDEWSVVEDTDDDDDDEVRETESSGVDVDNDSDYSEREL